jgi:hypothetical protein
MPSITVTGLNRAAEKYDPILRKLPFLVLGEELSKNSINLKEVTYKDTLIQFERKSGTSKPYAAGTIDYSDVGKMSERSLIVLPCYNAIKDHIMNYASKAVLNPTGDKVNNKTKDHPLEKEIIESHIRTIGEDIIDAMFHATRNTADKSPMGMLDGFFTQIATEIAALTISTANGNYATSGTLPVPSSDSYAFDRLFAWIRKAHPMLRKKPCTLYIAPDALLNAKDALVYQLGINRLDGYERFLPYLRQIADAPQLEIISTEALGSGSQLILTKPRTLDLGVNTKTDTQFVDVRNIFEDPNYVQFWSQWELGARINSLHEKEFFTNEQTNVATDMAGDYVS